MTSAQTRSRRSRLAKTEDISEDLDKPIGYLMTESEQKWRSPAMHRLSELVTLHPGWDGYQGAPVKFENAYFAMQMLDACCRANDPTPQIVPGASGDLQIEWHLERGDIELHILAPNNVHAWYADESNGFAGEEISLTTDFTTVANWIKNLTEPTRATVPAVP
jgi:hypothetical protein